MLAAQLYWIFSDRLLKNHLPGRPRPRYPNRNTRVVSSWAERPYRILPFGSGNPCRFVRRRHEYHP